MQSASCVSMKCEPKNVRVASCDSGNLRVVIYNSTRVWVANCQLIITQLVRGCINLHYIKFALSVYMISSMHVKQSKGIKVGYIPIIIYTWKQLWDLLWFKWKLIGKIYKYLCKYRLITETSWSQVTEWLFYRFWKIPRKATAVEFYFSAITGPVILLKQGPTTGVFVFFPLEQIYFVYNTSRRLLLNLYTIS